jgi:uncharacterized protein (TIGR02145 family)
MAAFTPGTRRSVAAGCLEGAGDYLQRATGGNWRGPTVESARTRTTREAAYAALLTGGSSSFGALLAGGRSDTGEYARLEAHGFYWTASECDQATAWFYNVGKGGLALHRQRKGEKRRGFSVRCVED